MRFIPPPLLFDISQKTYFTALPPHPRNASYRSLHILLSPIIPTLFHALHTFSTRTRTLNDDPPQHTHTPTRPPRPPCLEHILDPRRRFQHPPRRSLLVRAACPRQGIPRPFTGHTTTQGIGRDHGQRPTERLVHAPSQPTPAWIRIRCLEMGQMHRYVARGGRLSPVARRVR
jgi:hypothetical protein